MDVVSQGMTLKIGNIYGGDVTCDTQSENELSLFHEMPGAGKNSDVFCVGKSVEA